MKLNKRIAAALLAVSLVASVVFSVTVLADPVTNKALGATVTSNAQLSNFDIQHATDGNDSKDAGGSACAITSFDSSGLSYYEINFTEETAINNVKLFFNKVEVNQRPKDIAIDVKYKDGTYVRVAEMHNIDYNPLSGNIAGINELSFVFNSAEVLSFRVTANRQRTRDVNNEPSAGYNFRLMEIKAFDDPALTIDDNTGTAVDENNAYNIPIPEPVLVNLLAGSSVSTNEQLGNYSVNRLVDGKKDLLSDCSITRYNAAHISYSEITLAEPTLLNHVRLYFSTYEPIQRPKDIAVDVLLESGVYVRVAEMHNINYEITGSNSAGVNRLDFKFAAQNAVAVKVSGSRYRNVSNSNNFRLVEIEGYNNASVRESDFTGTKKDENNNYNIPVSDANLENLAIGGAVTTNRQLDNYDVNRLTDGTKKYNADASTNAIARWDTATMQAWFEVELPEAKTVNQIAVFLTQYEKSYLPKELAVDVRLTNGVYVRVGEMHNINYTPLEKILFSFSDKEIVAFRVSGCAKRNQSSANFRLIELEAYYHPLLNEDDYCQIIPDENELYNIPLPEPVLTNFASGKVVKANDVLSYKDENQNVISYDAARLTNGVNDYYSDAKETSITKWDTLTKTGWFEVELGEPTTINQVSAFLSQFETSNLPKDIAIDVRLSNGVYKRAAEMHDIAYTNVKKLTFRFAEQEAVAFRITGKYTRNGSSSNFRLVELEAYCNPELTEKDYTGTKKDSNDDYNIEVPEPVLNNIAIGKAVKANDTLSYKDENQKVISFDAERLTNGVNDYLSESTENAITKWDTSTKTGWYEVEFGGPEKINQISAFLSQYEKSNLPKDVAVDIRLSNGVYKRVAEMHDIDYTGLKKLTFRFAEQEAVAFRITGKYTRNSSSSNFRLVELEAYYNPEVTEKDYTGTKKDSDEKYNIEVPEAILINLALGKTVKANDVLSYKDENQTRITYDTSRLTDGNNNYYADNKYCSITQWNRATKTGWFEVEFDKLTTINQVRIFLSQFEKKNLPKDMAIDVRMSNGVYKRVAELHDFSFTDKKTVTFYFEPQEVVAFRITGKYSRNGDSGNFRLVEIEAYNNAGISPDKYTGTGKDANPDYNIDIPDPVLTNLALNKKVTCNEELTANGVTYSAARLTDGYKLYSCPTATGYTAITQWIKDKKIGWYEVSFDTVTDLNMVKVYFSQWQPEFLPKEMAIDVRLANGKYVRVAEMHNIDYKGLHDLTFYFKDQKAKGFRVIGNANRNKLSSNFRLLELEAFYYPGMPEEKLTGINKDKNSLYNMTDADLLEPVKDKKQSDAGNSYSGGSTSTSTGTNSTSAGTEKTEGKPLDMSAAAKVFLSLVAAGSAAFLAGDAVLIRIIIKRSKPI